MVYEDDCSILFLPDGETTCVESMKIFRQVLSLRAETIENRRWFHQNPELAFKEVATARKVAELLRSYGLDEVFEGIGKVTIEF